MSDTSVTLPFSHVVAIATRLGSQDVDVCPTDDHECWRHRDAGAYLPRDIDECRECFLNWILRGD